MEVFMSTEAKDPVWTTFKLSDLYHQQRESGRPWLPFLRVSTLSAGLYVLPKGVADEQQPHDRDELYYVVSGRAVIEVEGERGVVGPGTVIYVKARANHQSVHRHH